MSETTREIYVISDLHIGGRYPDGKTPGDRGFRICTQVPVLARFVRGVAARGRGGADVELVVNGDFIDFLSEESPAGQQFLPFVDDPTEALRRFDLMIERDRELFDAFAELHAAGARITILLGNHDVELSFPRVRARLLSRIAGDGPSRVTFLYDNEAHVVGDAVIEHGNAYDSWNVVDHEQLRKLRSLQSRHYDLVVEDAAFTPPPGSRLVADVMNPIKLDYPFVDLLKPEIKAMIPVLLALAPDLRGRIKEVVKLGIAASRTREKAQPGMPAFGDIASFDFAAAAGGDLAAVAGDISSSGDEVDRALADTLGPAAAARFKAGLAAEPEEPPPAPTAPAAESGDIASYGIFDVAKGFANLAFGREKQLDRRLPALLEALRIVQNDKSFSVDEEADPAYLEGARTLAEQGRFRWVIFGHTHLAKRVDLGVATYINTGTWADLIRFPIEVLSQDDETALAALKPFVADLAARRLAPYIWFRPTYAYLEVRGDRVVTGELCTFEQPGCRLAR